MNVSNALSAKNVKIHGMSSARWTTKDKITQYKGLVKLYKRDRDISLVDSIVERKRQSKGLKNLRKSIENERLALDNAIAGDRQTLRNTLAEHRNLQLAYQNSEPKKVLECVDQVSFTQRKVLDKLKYQTQLRSTVLIDLKQEEALLEDRLKYNFLLQLPQEKTAQIITGKVQDAFLKKEAALAIQQSYVQIIDVMKKDALYFDSILLTIQHDNSTQCRFVLNAAKQGQLATEYKNDREQEFETLEMALVEGMNAQKLELKQLQEQSDIATRKIRLLIRKDSDITTCVVVAKDGRDVLELNKHLGKIETTLSFLRNTTLVSSFDAIYPSLLEQKRQKERLTALAKKCARSRDLIMNKYDHAQVMSNLLKNSMVESTGDYKRRKAELLAEIQEKEKLIVHTAAKNTFKHNLIAKVRLSLRQLQQLCCNLRDSGAVKADNVQFMRGTGPMFSDRVVEPQQPEIEDVKIIALLTPKLTNLMHSAQEKFDETKTDEAFKLYEVLMSQRSLPLEMEKDTNECLLEGFVSEMSHLLTREDIKRQSASIVRANMKAED